MPPMRSGGRNWTPNKRPAKRSKRNKQATTAALSACRGTAPRSLTTSVEEVPAVAVMQAATLAAPAIPVVAVTAEGTERRFTSNDG